LVYWLELGASFVAKVVNVSNGKEGVSQ